MNSNYALAVTSGTAALRVALASLNLKKGDEVISERHQKDFKKEEYSSKETTTESFTDISFDDI